MPELTSALVADLPKSGPSDPIEFYRRPLVGFLYRERINMGLRLLRERTFDRALEAGFGSGAVLLVLSSIVKKLHGIDLDADPKTIGETLQRRGVAAELRNADVCSLPYESSFFDLVVSFSVFEHLHEYERALAEVARVLQPGGVFLLGMPAVNKAMSAAFRAIGFRGIDDLHVTSPADVARALLGAGFSIVRSRRLGLQRVPGAALYYTWLLEKA